MQFKSTPRAFWIWVHRWVGLVMASFLVIAALTGSMLAWLDELESWLAPHMMLAVKPYPDAKPLDPFLLREKVIAQLPSNAVLPWIPLHVEQGKSLRFGVDSIGAPLPYDDVFVNPYTGKILDKRKWGDLTQGAKGVMTFVYRLHYSLALDKVGSLLMGVVAVTWTLDCFIGIYLTFPPRRKTLTVIGAEGKRRSWLERWWSAWRVRWNGSYHKINFDLHRAGGLWAWVMLFVLAWSSVAFNLKEIYSPVTKYLLGTQHAQPDRSHIPLLLAPRTKPSIEPHEALDIGRALLARHAATRDFIVKREDWLGYEPERGIYTLIVTSSRDIRDRYGGNTRLFFDGNNGVFLGLYLPTGDTAGDTLTTWITSLHMAGLLGVPMKIFISLMGLVVAILSVTGVYIWIKKRASRRVIQLQKMI